ncbi:unnamed protein product, partial [Onchocerca flexuosa]|uniref:7TM_GPCR_Srx domain-containing protein n=1 Tax=Onchocerca flexuosa TaxID=387005 RepID=A0A183HW43_9BILA
GATTPRGAKRPGDAAGGPASKREFGNDDFSADLIHIIMILIFSFLPHFIFFIPITGAFQLFIFNEFCCFDGMLTGERVA